MRLCQSLGVLHPDHLFDVLTARQLEDWIYFDSVEPWGAPAADFRSAMQTWGSLQPHAGKKSLKPDQFLPQWGGADPQTPEAYKLKHRAVMARATAGL